MYYAAINTYSTETSVGFANTWGVLVFRDRTARDTYVAEDTRIATKAISRKDVPYYVTRAPRPFSGEACVICDEGLTDKIDGCIGTICIGTCDTSGYVQHLTRRN